MHQRAQGFPAPPRGPIDRWRRKLSERGKPSRRLGIGFLVIAIIASVFVGRLIQLQGVDPHAYAAAARAQNTITQVLPATRGEIVDRNGKPLADSVDGLMVTADPSMVSAAQAPQLAALLSKDLSVDYAATLAKLQKTSTRFQYIARRVPSSIALAAEQDAHKAGFGAVFTDRDPIRSYPQGDVAANIVGFMGTDGPLAGLELSFNKALSGTDGKETYVVADQSSDTRVPLGGDSTVQPVNGTNLKLTIDSDVQWYVQRVLRQADQSVGALNGMAVVIDSKTGEVLALADDPTFDASDPNASKSSDLGARSISEVYEPGSVEKVLTLSSLINLGKVTPETKEVIPAALHRQDTVIHDWFAHGTLHYTLAGVVAQSSNIGTVLAADKFGHGQLHSFLEQFGLGSSTDSGLPGESAGILPTMKQWDHEIQDRVSFGQSVSVTALQMAAAENTIANGGVRIDPSIIMGKATTDSGLVVGTDVATTRRVVSQHAATETMEMMERVPDPATGTAPGARVPGYRVAGKTGTAQRVNPKCSCYTGGGYTVSFSGFAPADNPRFTVYVVINKPSDEAASGGGTAGPVFGKIMSFLLRHYGVPPTGKHPSHLPTTW